MHPAGPVADGFRERLRREEEARLSPLAVHSHATRGRAHEEDACGLRSPFQRDRDRIVHSKAFRRLKHKTQVFVAPEGDHYRTRLTHTLEAVGISRTVARALRLNEDLTEAIGLGHDLGHPPFGHAGEAALDAALQERFERRFRHNEHSLRVVERAGARRPRAEPDRTRCATASSTTRGRPRPRRSRGASSSSSTASRTSTTTSTTRSAPACCGSSDLPPEPVALLGRTGSRAHRRARARPRRDERGAPATSRRARAWARRCSGLRTFLFANVYLRRPAGRGGRRGRAASCARCSTTSASTPTSCRRPRRRRSRDARHRSRRGHDRPLRDPPLPGALRARRWAGP